MCRYANDFNKIPLHAKNLHICTYAYPHISMSLSDFFTPVELKQITPKKGFYSSHLGEKIAHFSNSFPDLEQKIDIAIIGVQDDRNAINNQGCALAPDHVREKLYQLFEGPYKTKIADLGNIRQGATISDT